MPTEAPSVDVQLLEKIEQLQRKIKEMTLTRQITIGTAEEESEEEPEGKRFTSGDNQPLYCQWQLAAILRACVGTPGL